jgi:hypothetical protein
MLQIVFKRNTTLQNSSSILAGKLSMIKTFVVLNRLDPLSPIIRYTSVVMRIVIYSTLLIFFLSRV